MQATLPPLANLFPALRHYNGDDFPKQKAHVLDSRAKYELVAGAARSGKTFGSGEHCVRRLCEDTVTLPWDEPKLGWLIAPTHDDGIAQKLEFLRLMKYENANSLHAMYPAVDWRKQGEKHEFFDESHGRGTLFLHANWTIGLKTAERPETLVARKVRFIWATEIARMKAKVWPNMYSRLSNYDDSWLIGDTSALGRCWFYIELWARALEGNFKGAACHEWTAHDSPYISSETIAEAKENLSLEYYRREFEADWSAFQGQIYNMWNREVHVRPQPFNTRRAIIAVDINTTSESPAAMSTTHMGGEHITKRGKQERAHLAREYYEVIGLDYERYARDIAAEYYRNARKWRTTVLIDPSAHTYFKGMLDDLGVPYHNAENKVDQGIRTLGGAMMPKRDLGMPLFTVDPSCTNFPNEVEGYAYKVTPSGVVAEQPSKTSPDHLLDCLRYTSMEAWSGYGEAKQLR